MPPANAYEHARRLHRRGCATQARDAYLGVLARDPTHAGALANLGALLFAAGYTSAARIVFTQAVAAHPGDPAPHVQLANLLRQADSPQAARAAYEAALRLDPTCPEAHQGMSYLLDASDPCAASRHRTLGFANRVLTTSDYHGDGPPVTVLQLVSAYGGNIPTRRILDDRHCRTHTLVVDFADRAMDLPPHDVVFNAIGDADRCAPSLAAARGLLGATGARVVNPPDKVMATTRAENARRLARLHGVIVPHMAIVPRAACAEIPPGFTPPFLLRSPGFHTGQHFHRIDHASDLPAALAALPGDNLVAIEYLNAFGPDGAARKYRVMFIGGVLMPLHLAIGTGWKLHYFSADMARCADHRAEEAAFLDDMAPRLGPIACAALAAIAATLGLDYGGIDFALAPDGRVILFEANATMVLVPPPLDPMWDYRRPAIKQALAAATGLVTERLIFLKKEAKNFCSLGDAPWSSSFPSGDRFLF